MEIIRSLDLLDVVLVDDNFLENGCKYEPCLQREVNNIFWMIGNETIYVFEGVI